jgi:glyoxylase-like metal-dependent hydrolase (beta-lactamase superfamily II)
MSPTRVFTIAVLALAITGTAQAVPASAADELPYGDVVRVAPSTLMVVGRELNPAKGEADIANVILYRPGDTLYVIDSGATPSFRPFLHKAISRMRPFRNLVLINTHGHPDHIGNNDLVMATPAARKRHYMSRLDFSLADNYVEESLAAGIAGVSGYIPGFDDPTAQAQDLFELFTPLEQSTSTRRALESLPQRPLRIGRLRTRGWAFGNHDVEVLRTGAHTHGELVAYLPRTHLLHTADETISIYPVWPESSAARTRRVFVELLAAASGDGARILTEGHTFSVLRGAGRIRRRVQSLRDGYDAYDQAVRRVLTEAAPQGATVADLVDRVPQAPELANAPGGGQTGVLFTALQVVKKLQQLHAVVVSGDTRGTERWVLPPS